MITLCPARSDLIKLTQSATSKLLDAQPDKQTPASRLLHWTCTRPAAAVKATMFCALPPTAPCFARARARDAIWRLLFLPASATSGHTRSRQVSPTLCRARACEPSPRGPSKEARVGRKSTSYCSDWILVPATRQRACVRLGQADCWALGIPKSETCGMCIAIDQRHLPLGEVQTRPCWGSLNAKLSPSLILNRSLREKTLVAHPGTRARLEASSQTLRSPGAARARLEAIGTRWTSGEEELLRLRMFRARTSPCHPNLAMPCLQFFHLLFRPLEKISMCSRVIGSL